MSNEVGRPTKYKEEYNEQAYKLCLLGHTDEELAQFFEIATSTLYEWKLNHPEFAESIKKGKEIADGNVVASLYHRAIGYQAPDIDIKMYEGKIIETPYIKHYPPDATSAIFWLKNRQPKKWRDKQVTEHEGQITIETKSMEDIFK
ncbi:terminase [Acinetobacter phage BUCT629]|uniref:Terminase small subunit n=1 Tax=Acinetobacter phage LZ35 TaxID=1792222 RepID=A0A190XCG3_9CAUD|nr:terminase small subunit [Acinetobacter phage LZ35]AMD43229.1 terminase small subunit [Acinetobacter phage LZ35]QZI85359.1 terminase [Acinetobacter phage BUCT629]WJZ47760.1 terminase small subunit [Acinetobacter phage NJ02]